MLQFVLQSSARSSFMVFSVNQDYPVKYCKNYIKMIILLGHTNVKEGYNLQNIVSVKYFLIESQNLIFTLLNIKSF